MSAPPPGLTRSAYKSPLIGGDKRLSGGVELRGDRLGLLVFRGASQGASSVSSQVLSVLYFFIPGASCTLSSSTSFSYTTPSLLTRKV